MSEPPTVLIVEDEPKLAELLRDYLEQDNYRTHWLASGNQAVDWVRSNKPDIVLLDLMLPGKDGLSICREVRSFSNVPIIFVTARVEEIDRLIGLELGADDYICKPFSPREVVARVKAIRRRIAHPGAKPDARGLEVDEEKYQATYDGEPLDLTPVEFRLLAMFVGQPGRVFSREQLMNRIYVDDRVVSDRTVDSHIKNLRQKLNAASSDELIRSIYGVGYKLD